MDILVAATHNKGKLAEMKKILSAFELRSVGDYDGGVEPEENGATFEENALIKARAAYACSGLPSFGDDSGLCVDALGGAPGVRSARYSGGGDADNRALLLKNLAGVSDRRAHFNCAVALVCPDGRELTAEGRTEGSILTEERGEHGFGYDSLFFSSDLNKSFAEADEAEKNAVSHRGRALKRLEELL